MKITFIGLGKMGSAIAERLLKANYDVTVYNRTEEKTLPLVKSGAKPSPSLPGAVKQADVVITSLLNDEAVLSVTDAMLSALPKTAIHIGLSTILPDTAIQLEKKHKHHGSQYLSAVVLGVPKVAKKGELTTFCAGLENTITSSIPILETFSNKVIPLGDMIQSPNVMKICMNYSLITAIELISELYIFVEKSGLDTEIVKMELHQIYAHPAFKLYIDKIHERNFDDVNFDMIGGNKDVSIFQEAFSNIGVVPEIGNIAKSRFTCALAQGMQNKDWSGIYELVRTEAGLDSKPGK